MELATISKHTFPIPRNPVSVIEEFLSLLRTFSIVTDAWMDQSKPLFDIYYKLKGEDFVRGLYVRALTPKTDKPNSYNMSGLNNFTDGMLIIGINQIIGIGLMYLFSDKYNKKRLSITFTKNPRSEFSKLLKYWDDFIIYLQEILSRST